MFCLSRVDYTMRFLIACLGGAMLLVGLGTAGCMSVEEPSPADTRREGSQPSRIGSFSGEYRYLSNFWPAEVTFEGHRYPSVEHAYQAAKSLDAAARSRIAALPTPSEAKRAGRALTYRSDWDRVKLDVMEQCVRDKFKNNADLGAKLLATGEAELVEGNDWGDEFWGVCEGRGANHLGKILMKIRAELRQAKASP